MQIFIACVVAAFLLAGVLYWRWSIRIKSEIAEGAQFEWDRLTRNEPDFLKGLDRPVFDRVYSQVHFPRFPKYFLTAVAAFVLALPITFGILSGSVWLLESIGVFAEPDEIAKYVPISGDSGSENAERNREMALLLAKNFSGFYYFFGVIAAWLAIVAIAARRYYARRPGYLRDELIRARESANPETSPEASPENSPKISTQEESDNAVSPHHGPGEQPGSGA